MKKMDVANNLFAAIDTIVDKKLAKLKFDRCIIGHLIEKVDENNYKVQYLDNTIKAQPIAGLTITEEMIGQGVYVLVPSNDFSKQLFILAII